MAFDKTELKQLKFLFKESDNKTEKLIKESEKRTEKMVDKKTRAIVRSETRLIVCEALEELVLPRLQAVEDKQEEQGRDIKEIKVTQEGHSDSLERIENIQRVEVKRDDAQDEKLEIHEQRIFKVEKIVLAAK